MALKILPNTCKIARAWQQVDNSTHHITTHLWEVDENVNLAKSRRLCSAFPHLEFGVHCWCGVGGPQPGVGPAGLQIRAPGKYLDPARERDRYGLQNPAYGGTKVSGDQADV